MPEIITIIFNHGDNGSMSMYSSDIDSVRKGEEALEELVDFLETHHISYFHKYISREEMEAEEERLDKSGAREIAV
jgi:hypothetical protein